MKRLAAIMLMLAMLLCGCSVHTVENLYCLPKRSEAYQDLQLAIDRAMGNLRYCAPLAGENRQSVQLADLDGDGGAECLLFAKETTEKPLRILVFCKVDGAYALADTIELYGTAFDRVEYVSMDASPGKKLIVGCQLSDGVTRSVSAYRFSDGYAVRLLSTAYSRFICCDLDADGYTELTLLSPGEGDGHGEAAYYRLENAEMVCGGTAEMSQPAESLRRVISGALQDGGQAIYAASAAGDRELVTDVFAIRDGAFVNLAYTDASDGDRTRRRDPAYAADIDDDGVIELPQILPMRTVNGEQPGEDSGRCRIRWYALSRSGEETDKCYTYHNFTGGWYLELPQGWAERLSVVREQSEYAFYLWNEEPEKILTIFAFTGEDREERAQGDNYFVLQRTDTVTYAACLEVASGALGLSSQEIEARFHLIRESWKTGET